MFEVGQRVKVLVDRAFSTETGMRGREGTVLHNAVTSESVTYVKLDGPNKDERYIQGERVACEVFGNEQLKLVEAKEEENMQEIKVGDMVEVVKGYTAPARMVGVISRVAEIIGDDIYVEDPTGKALFTHNGVNTWVYSAWHLKKVVQPKPTKAKSQKISIEEVQVGDEIVSFRNSSGVETRRKGVVGKIVEGVARTNEGNILTHFYNSAGGICPAHHVYLLNRPEPKKPEIEDGTYYVTSTMEGVGPWKVTVANEVADWRYGKDWQHQAFGTYKGLVEAKSGKRIDMEFHTEDPTPKGFAALDKTKTYFLERKNKPSAWIKGDLQLAFTNGRWVYGYVESTLRIGAKEYEKEFTEGTNSWEKPVELVEPELTDLEKFERAGYVGKKFDGGLIYKVTKKGKVKYKSGGEWVESFHSADTFFEDIKDGLVVGI